MARERWYVGGYELTQGVVRDVEYRNGLYVAPQQVGDNAAIPGQTGELWRAKKHGAGRFVLSMWLDDGAAGAGRVGTEANYDELLRGLFRPWQLVTFQRYLASGEVRQCKGEVVSDLAPDAVGQLAMRYAVEVHVPGAYWEAVADVSDASTTGGTLPQTLTLGSFALATAPMEELLYKIDGPISNPTVVDVTDGVDGWSWTYSGTVPSGQSISVDAKIWAVTGGGGFTVNHGAYAYTDTGRFMTVVPGAPGLFPTVQLRGTGGGGNTRLTVTGRPKFLV